MNDEKSPTGNLTMRTVAMPANANPSGDIFGGWVMSQMDLAAYVASSERAKKMYGVPAYFGSKVVAEAPIGAALAGIVGRRDGDSDGVRVVEF